MLTPIRPAATRSKLVGFLAAALLSCLPAWAAAEPAAVGPAAIGLAAAGEDAHGAIAMYGAPALPPGFDHLPYANPQAPKGGKLVLGLEGTFDSLNPFNVNAGSTAQGINGNVYQTLMTRSLDEPFTLYGLVADLDRDGRGAFLRHLPHRSPRPLLRWHPHHRRRTSLFTFNLLKSKGRPQQRSGPMPWSGRCDRGGRHDRPLRSRPARPTARCR